MILVAVVGFGLSVNAAGSCKITGGDGATVSASVDIVENGMATICFSNDSEKGINVTFKYCGLSRTIYVSPGMICYKYPACTNNAYTVDVESARCQ